MISTGSLKSLSSMLPPPHHPREHWQRVREEVTRMVAEVPLYKDRPTAPASDDPAAISAWLAAMPTVHKRDLRRGFPKSLVRSSCDLKAAMQNGAVEIIATSGTTENRLQVLWEWTWWDPQEREAMRLNARIQAVMAGEFREAVLTTPVCGGATCHIGTRTREERTIDGMLFLNQVQDPTHWTEDEILRMVGEWNDLRPQGVEADPQYLAHLCRFALQKGIALHAPEFVTLTYEQITRGAARAIKLALPSTLPLSLYGATEAGVLFMECTAGRLHHNTRHSHIELGDVGNGSGLGLGSVIVTTLGRTWMPLLRYEIGDLVTLAATPCACGRDDGGFVLARVEGRAADALPSQSGLLTPAMIDDIVDGADESIAQWQLARGAAGWELHVVGGDGLRAAAAVGERLGATVEPRPTTAIVAEASGKYRTVRAS
jgi:phenylacetate-coenzyme A ligase PaaK-like adenylate-forming protein